MSPLAEFRAANSTLPDHCRPLCHIVYTCSHAYTICHHSATGYPGGFVGSAWMAFFLYSLVSSSTCHTKTDVSPLGEFHSARSFSLITILHHTTECIYTLHTCTLCYSSLIGYLRGFSGSVWWPSFYTLWFLHQLNGLQFLLESATALSSSRTGYCCNLTILAWGQPFIVIILKLTLQSQLSIQLDLWSSAVYFLVWPRILWLTLQSRPFYTT